MGKSVLITGGSGYIGGHLALKLLEDDWSVVSLDTLVNSRDWRTVPETKKYNKRAFFKASVTNTDALMRSMQGVSLVYHLAARTDLQADPKHIMRMTKTNVLGTAAVLFAAMQTGVDNVVIASDYQIYGNVVGAEETYGPTNPVNMLGFTKLAAEQIAQSCIVLGMNVKILRLFSVWGGRFGSSDVDKFCRKEGELEGSGDNSLDFIHISDVVEALLSARLWDAGVFNIGTGDETTLGGLWDLINPDVKPRKKAVTSSAVQQVFRCCADMSFTYTATDWRPKVRLAELSINQIKDLSSTSYKEITK